MSLTLPVVTEIRITFDRQSPSDILYRVAPFLIEGGLSGFWPMSKSVFLV